MPTIRTANAEIAYQEQGQGDPLLMIMGFAGDSRAWLLQLPALSGRYRCITVDNRGTGGSSPLSEPCEMADMALDALAVLDDLGIDRAHVLGISMGGAIAQHLALKAPERVRSLILAATWSSKNGYLDRLADLGRRFHESLGHEALVRAMMLWLFSPRFFIDTAEFADGIETLMRDFVAPRETFMRQLDALLEHDVRDRLPSITAPTLVMSAERDVMVPRELQDELATLIPGATHQRFETAHAFNVEEMNAFNQAVLAWLDAH